MELRRAGALLGLHLGPERGSGRGRGLGKTEDLGSG